MTPDGRNIRQTSFRLKPFSRYAVLSLLLILGGCDANDSAVSITGTPAALKQTLDLSSGSQPSTAEALSLSDWLGGVAQSGFKRADKPRAFHFPRDHGPHDGFRTEWWYITGNLEALSGAGQEHAQRFGYQLTLFRIALAPHREEKHLNGNDTSNAPKSQTLHKQNAPRSSWQTRHLWMAHVALTDISGQRHYHEQRLIREGARLAGAEINPLRLWAEDWQISSARFNQNEAASTQPQSEQESTFPWQIHIDSEKFALNLELNPLKPVVLQGDNGLSQKSTEIGNASYYYSLTRLKTGGTVGIGGRSYKVSGFSWLDREWSTSALADEQTGWNWFSLQLTDGTDLMFYQLQRKDGSVDPFSAGKRISKDGTATTLSANQVQLEPLRYWQSPTSAKQYVTAWRMSLPEYGLRWHIEAAVENQEMKTAILYWEGAVKVLDSESGEIVGRGYLEMTGN